MEPASTGERKCRAGNYSAQGFEPLLRGIEVVGVQND